MVTKGTEETLVHLVIQDPKDVMVCQVHRVHLDLLGYQEKKAEMALLAFRERKETEVESELDSRAQLENCDSCIWSQRIIRGEKSCVVELDKTN